MIRLLLVIASAIGFLCPPVLGRITQVPAQAPSIQNAINNAAAGDTIIVAPGTYVENISFRGKQITVASQYLLSSDPTTIQQTIIDGGSPINSDSGSVVRFNNREDSTSVLCGFTLRNGIGTIVPGSFSGGGILVSNSSGPTICYNIIRQNSAFMGGGIAVRSSFPIIRNNAIVSNSARDGAGIWMDNASCVIDHNVIHANQAEGSGGAIFIKNSFTTITSSSISANGSPTCGGIACVSGIWSVENCNFYQNQAPSFLGCGGPGLGDSIVFKNYNRDSCDAFLNINVNPAFQNPVGYDYRLRCDSHLIDAGRSLPKTYPFGGSREDIGMFEYRYRVGDPNADGKVNLVDATLLINVIFLSAPLPCPLYADDCDCNRSINITDIVALINYWAGYADRPGCLFTPSAAGF